MLFDNHIHPKELRTIGYENIGNIYNEWEYGISRDVIQKIMSTLNVTSGLYLYIPDDSTIVQTHTAYKIDEARDAIEQVISKSVKVSKMMFESEVISGRYMIKNKIIQNDEA